MRPLLVTMAGVLLLACPVPAQTACEMVHLFEPVGEAGSDFGASVAVDGDHAVISTTGTMQKHVMGNGVYIYARSGRNWFLEQQIPLPAPGIGIGSHPDLDGTTLVFGADDDEVEVGSGAVFVYERREQGWEFVQKVKPNDPIAHRVFATDLALSGDWMVVGQSGGVTDLGTTGAVYLFHRVNGVWTQTQKLAPPDLELLDRFGFYVDLDGPTLVAATEGPSNFGVPRQMYVYELQGEEWVETAELFPEPYDMFEDYGTDVAVSGDTIAVGAAGNDDLGLSAGAVRLFRRTNGVWTQSQTLYASDAAIADQFGNSVDMDGDDLVVGAFNSGENGRGSAYLFQKEDDVWVERSKMVPSNPTLMGLFGRTFQVEGGIVALGTGLDDTRFGQNSGSAYLFSIRDDLCHTLEVAPERLSLSAGGTQTLEIDAGEEHAGAAYVLAGTMGALDPGFALDGLQVPLEMDAYFDLTLSPLADGFLPGHVGALDAEGRATAHLVLPPLGPALVDTVLHHAVVVLDARGVHAVDVSNAAPLKLVP